MEYKPFGLLTRSIICEYKAIKGDWQKNLEAKSIGAHRIMVSVTQRIKTVKQPYGGYLPIKEWEESDCGGSVIDAAEENIHPTVMGIAVDYLTRFMSNKDRQKSFKISLLGAEIINQKDKALKLLSSINGLDAESIKSACALVKYDTVFRAGPWNYNEENYAEPDANTIDNIKKLVERSLSFFKTYGKVLVDGFTFRGGYTDLVDSGDGDFITEGIIWDFKVSKNKPNKNHTLQLLMYYLMGVHSYEAEEHFNHIRSLGIFNPRLNKIWTKDIASIDKNIIDEVLLEVIGYSANNTRLSFPCPGVEV